MAFRSDVSVNWETSPRIITVLAPSTTISIQDLVDTCRINESYIGNLTFDYLISANGKDNLGSGILVGITATLKNAVLAFEARSGPAYTQCTVNGGNLVAVDGSNNNISPIYPTSFTQVVTTSSSSATLQQSTDIEYASFNGGVSININSSNVGTAFPVGTPRQKVNNFIDAIAIANSRGFDRLYLSQGITTLDSALDYSGFAIEGEGTNTTSIIVPMGTITNNTTFSELSITGVLDGYSHLEECLIYDLIYISGFIHNECVLAGTLTLNGNATINNTSSSIVGTTPSIDFNNGSASLAIRKYAGELLLKNKTNSSGTVSIDMNSGIITIDSSCTAGTITIRGVGQVIDNSNGSIVDTLGLINPQNVAEATWNDNYSTYPPGTLGGDVAKKKDVINAQIIFGK